jgi:hypothetical protein
MPSVFSAKPAEPEGTDGTAASFDLASIDALATLDESAVSEAGDAPGWVDDPQSFVFTRYWYQSAQIAYAMGGARPALCYNTDDPRGFAFWSRPEDWGGRDGVLVLVGDEPVVVAHYFARWFKEVGPASEFWVERGGKPVRRIRLYRCRQQHTAFPFGFEQADRLVRNPRPHGETAGRSSR